MGATPLVGKYEVDDFEDVEEEEEDEEDEEDEEEEDIEDGCLKSSESGWEEPSVEKKEGK